MRQKTYYYLIRFDLYVDNSMETEIVGQSWAHDEYEEELPALKRQLICYFRKKRPEAVNIRLSITEVKMVDKRRFEREIKSWKAVEPV